MWNWVEKCEKAKEQADSQYGSVNINNIGFAYFII